MPPSPGFNRVQKGALVGVNPPSVLSSIITFQYNPHEITRTVTPRYAEPDSLREMYRVSGPPAETISFTLRPDRTAEVSDSGGSSGSWGIHPRLAALEMLVYPSTVEVLEATQRLDRGMLEVLPSFVPFTILIWGEPRVLPVRVKSLQIREINHDPRLNPMQAEVDIELEVMSYRELSVKHPGFWIFLAHQAFKEALATRSSTGSLMSSV